MRSRGWIRIDEPTPGTGAGPGGHRRLPHCAREKLSKLTGVLLAYPGSYRIEIEGHADAVGSEDYNIRLSRDRAESVGSYLVTSGLPATRIGSTLGLGEDRPVASNDTAAGRQLNRRVEVVITDLEG